MASSFWRGVQVSVESARAATKTITAVTKANPAVATSVAHGYSNGDYVYILAQGMWQIDRRVVRVANKADDTFQLEGVDSTLFDTFTSGTAAKLTLGTSLSILVNVTGSGGDPEFADETTIHDTVRSQTPVLSTPLTFSMEGKWDPSDAGLIALKTISDSLSSAAIMFVFSNSSRFLFEGYIQASLVPTGSFGELVKTPITASVRGKLQAYAT
jgi:hypothetical protein